MERLTDLPNIGPKLAGNLERIGVTTQEQFQALGRRRRFCASRPKWNLPPASTSWKHWQGRRRASRGV